MHSKPSQPAGERTSRSEAAAALAEIKRRQEGVIKTVLVPVWYWWVLATAIIAIGVARDSGDSIVEAIAIPIAVLVMAGFVRAAIPEVRRRIQVHSDPHFKSRMAAAIFALIVVVDGTIVATAASAAGAHDRDPAAIGTAAGAAAIVIAGPILNWYARTLMLRQIRQPAGGDAQRAGIQKR